MDQEQKVKSSRCAICGGVPGHLPGCPTQALNLVVKQEQPKHSHYFRPSPYKQIDIYRVLQVFEVTDPALQHIGKKALCAGIRGHKSLRRDLEDIRDTAQRRLDMMDEDEQLKGNQAA